MASNNELREFRNLVRAANRRLERAGAGQKAALEHYMSGYHTRTNGEGELRFSAAAPKTAAEMRQRTAELEKFMAGKTSTQRGWSDVQARATSKAQEKLGQMGYDVTDEELKNIAKETGGHNAAFYRALEQITAEKLENEYEDMFDNEEELAEEIELRRTDQEITERLIRARQNAKNKRRR